MITQLSDRILRLSTGWVALATALLMIVFMVGVLPGQAESARKSTGSSRSPDTSLGYPPAALFQMAEEYGEEGRQAYIQARWTFDLVFPLVYGAFLTTGISWFSRRLPGLKPPWGLGNLLPLSGVLFDYLENGAASLLMALYPARLVGLPEVVIASNLLKWLLISLSFLLWAGYAMGALVTWIRSRMSN